MIAHVGGVPLEEALLPFAGGAGAGLILLGGPVCLRACAMDFEPRADPCS